MATDVDDHQASASWPYVHDMVTNLATDHASGKRSFWMHLAEPPVFALFGIEHYFSYIKSEKRSSSSSKFSTILATHIDAYTTNVFMFIFRTKAFIHHWDQEDAVLETRRMIVFFRKLCGISVVVHIQDICHVNSSSAFTKSENSWYSELSRKEQIWSYPKFPSSTVADHFIYWTWITGRFHRQATSSSNPLIPPINSNRLQVGWSRSLTILICSGVVSCGFYALPFWMTRVKSSWFTLRPIVVHIT